MLRIFPLLLVLALTIARAADRLVVDDDAFIERATAAAKELHKAGKLVSFEKLRSQLGRQDCEMKAPAPRTEKLQPREIYRLVRASTVAVASFYKCAKCDDWHFDTSSGFVAANGVVSTCEHVVDFEDKGMKDGFLVVADSTGAVYAVAEVLAANKTADTCLLRVPGLPLKPLALNPAAEVGDRVFCVSHPDGNHWMFTAGMLSRFFINREPPPDDGKAADKAKALPSLYINITAEFSPGSSGAPVVDECGNVVGQVQSITAELSEEEGEKGTKAATSYGMPLRSCVSAEEIARLVKRPAKAAK